MPKYRFDHVHSITADPLATAEIYQKIFGAQKVSVDKIDQGDSMLVTLKLGDSVIKLMPPRPKPLSVVSGLEHFCINTDNIEEALNDIQHAGAHIVRGIIHSSHGIKAAFVSIENTLIELQELVDSK